MAKPESQGDIKRAIRSAIGKFPKDNRARQEVELALNNASAYLRGMDRTGSRGGYVPLEEVIKNLRKEPHHPELVTNFYQSLIASAIDNSGAKISTPTVSACPYSSKELQGMAKGGERSRVAVYVPETSYQELGLIFPQMGSYAVREGSPIRDERETVGWTDTERSVDAPYRGNKGMDERELVEEFERQGRVGARLRTYILASQASKALTSRYLDEGATWSRLPGSRNEGQVVGAYFCSLGHLRVGSYLGSEGRDPGLGGRSEGV